MYMILTICFSFNLPVVSHCGMPCLQTRQTSLGDKTKHLRLNGVVFSLNTLFVSSSLDIAETNITQTHPHQRKKHFINMD